MEYTKDVMPNNPGWTYGDHSYGRIAILGDMYLERLSIGKFCSIGSSVIGLVKGYQHEIAHITTYPFGSWYLKEEWPDLEVMKPKKSRYLIIGNDVWIGQSVMIMSDVTIGDGAVIGARALVTKDVPPYTVVGGNPAKEIKRRFTYSDRGFLLKFKWWDKPDKWISDHADILMSGDISQLRKDEGG